MVRVRVRVGRGWWLGRAEAHGLRALRPLLEGDRGGGGMVAGVVNVEEGGARGVIGVQVDRRGSVRVEVEMPVFVGVLAGGLELDVGRAGVGAGMVDAGAGGGRGGDGSGGTGRRKGGLPCGERGGEGRGSPAALRGRRGGKREGRHRRSGEGGSSIG